MRVLPTPGGWATSITSAPWPTRAPSSSESSAASSRSRPTNAGIAVRPARGTVIGAAKASSRIRTGPTVHLIPVAAAYRIIRNDDAGATGGPALPQRRYETAPAVTHTKRELYALVIAVPNITGAPSPLPSGVRSPDTETMQEHRRANSTARSTIARARSSTGPSSCAPMLAVSRCGWCSTAVARSSRMSRLHLRTRHQFAPDPASLETGWYDDAASRRESIPSVDIVGARQPT